MGARKKFNYDGKDFYDAIGNLANRDFDDHEIALHIGEEIRSIIRRRNQEAEDAAIDAELEELPEPEEWEDIPDSLSASDFSKMKNGKYEGWNEQENALRSMLISQVLQRARTNLCLAYKGVYDKLALGKWKTKTITETTQTKVDREGNPYEEKTTQETTQEIPPNLQALTMWRFHHDQEFKKALTQMKKMDIAVEDKSIDKVSVQIVYNKKEDTELQKKPKRE